MVDRDAGGMHVERNGLNVPNKVEAVIMQSSLALQARKQHEQHELALEQQEALLERSKPAVT